MLTLYHGANSVCSQKARLALAEKQLDWESREIDLTRGEQFAPAYLALNPDGVVPTLVHDGFVVRESSVIVEYVDAIGGEPRLLGDDLRVATATRLWLVRTLAIHEAINSISFATFIRDMEMARRSPEEIETWLSGLPNPQIAAKRRDLMANGPDSVFVAGALRTLGLVLRDIDAAVSEDSHLVQESYGLADTALTAYVDRLERLGLAGLWENRPRVANWLAKMRNRESYAVAIAAHIPDGLAAAQRASGERAWAAIRQRMA